MNPLKFISDIFKPASDLIDNIHTSAEEKGQIKLALDQISSKVTSQLIELQTKVLDMQGKIIVAEAQGASWIQRNWRPLTMLTFLALVVLDSLGGLPNRLAPEALEIIKIGLGGYVVGRSVEKAIDKWKQS